MIFVEAALEKAPRGVQSTCHWGSDGDWASSFSIFAVMNAWSSG